MDSFDRREGAEGAGGRLRSLAATLLSPSLLEAVPDAIVAVNQEGVIVQVNSQTEGLFGYAREELIGQRIETLVPERQREQHSHHRDHFAQQPKARRMGAGLDLRGRRRDGSEFPVEISLSPVPTDDGIVVLSAIRDVSDRKRIEAELTRANQELERAQGPPTLGISEPAFADCRFFPGCHHRQESGWHHHPLEQGGRVHLRIRGQEVIGRSITLLAPPDRQDEIPSILERIRSGAACRTLRYRAGRKRRTAPACLGFDFAHSRRQRQDRRGIHHRPKHDGAEEGRGPTAAVPENGSRGTACGRHSARLQQHSWDHHACAELLRTHVTSEELPQELIGHIRDASKRGAALTRQLLAFSRKQPSQPKVLDLNDRLKEVCKLLRPLMGDDVSVMLLPRSELAFVRADPGQLDQVLLNLAVNSRDAMPHGGKFIIETATSEFDEDFVRQHPPMKPGRYVMLAVSDNGTGMSEATRSRIFEPFFTTKEVGKGTGLGLATVYGIVQQSGGHIWVYSEPGRGTTFKVYLPCTDAEAGLAARDRRGSGVSARRRDHHSAGRRRSSDTRSHPAHARRPRLLRDRGRGRKVGSGASPVRVLSISIWS